MQLYLLKYWPRVSIVDVTISENRKVITQLCYMSFQNLGQTLLQEAGRISLTFMVVILEQ